ncbi:MAG TPA: TerD family protein, partial [Longimicrobium sp.]|nr:TerD family protein [Longimicrobium sp.]
MPEPAVETLRFQRGQRGPLPRPAGMGPGVLDLRVQLSPGRIRSDIDVCCLCLGADGRLGDERYLVFYNQRCSPEGAVQMQSMSTHTGGTQVQVDLEKLPGIIERVVVTASIDGPEKMADLAHGEIELRPEGGNCRIVHEFRGADFSGEQALILGELYRRGAEWRFRAVSQGFAGGLAKLLEHFGAEVQGETVRASTPVPLAPPSSAPVVIPEHEETGLQRLVDGATPGGVLRLSRNEYAGPVRVQRPLTIEGNGSTLWSRSGPVLHIGAAGVRLRNLGIEVTGSDESGESGVALSIAPGCAPEMHQVQVRGRVVGLGEETGEWALPAALSLGTLAPRQRNEFRLALRVPVACYLSSAVSGVRLTPEALPAGETEVTLSVEGVGADTLIAGE